MRGSYLELEACRAGLQHFAAEVAAVIVSGGGGLLDGTVRIWRLADGSPIGDPLELDTVVQAVGCHGDEKAIGSQPGVLTLRAAYR